MFCPRCGLEQPSDHRFCLSCGSRIPAELLGIMSPKVTRWFWTIPVTEHDSPHGAIRVSRYLEEQEIRTADGSVRLPNHHVRFSVWLDDRAVCAVSLPDDEAASLGEFLLASVSDASRSGTETGAIGQTG